MPKYKKRTQTSLGLACILNDLYPRLDLDGMLFSIQSEQMQKTQLVRKLCNCFVKCFPAADPRSKNKLQIAEFGGGSYRCEQEASKEDQARKTIQFYSAFT